MKYHQYSQEILYHFNCGDCKNWWSYATIEPEHHWKNQTMSCPHCGYHLKIQPIGTRKPKEQNAPFISKTSTSPNELNKPFISKARTSPTAQVKRDTVVKFFPEDTDRNLFAT